MDQLERELNAIDRAYPNLRFVFPDPRVGLPCRRIVASANAALMEQQEFLDQLISDSPDLLIEKVLSNPDLAKAVAKQYRESNDANLDTDRP